MKHAAAPYDIGSIRADFPILKREINGRPLVYLDTAASAQKPRAVTQAMVDLIENDYANVHRGLHFLANRSTDVYEGVRETVCRFLNASTPREVVFTRSVTGALNLLASSLGRHQRIVEGDEIILSELEHHSNIVPWHFWRERHGAVIRWAPVDNDGNLIVDALEELLSSRTKIVSITHMSNVVGMVTPIKHIAALCRARGIPLVVDGAQGAVHLPLDVQDLGTDFYCFTGHKVYGPTGIGVLYGRLELLDKLPPFEGGGEMIETVTKDTVSYNSAPHRFEAGTPPIIEAAGLGAALDYLSGIGREAVLAHETALTHYAHARLEEFGGIEVYGRAAHKGSIIAFNLKGAHAHDVATILDRAGVAVRAGTHCASPLLAKIGKTSSCRASLGLYSTKGEIDALIDALGTAQRILLP
ncbi:SufS family cysteine desulfurase [Ochrobactrum vermis]|uniref:Cysteine desulfurase n=1 Tax=Ochrobactrum vermis TaxID=1827297 RepID=A0ABU8PL81_9HYPH|nr:SufS family cysteine desulfurase [Ochrobactrum vermis]PQZ24386.1 cysteine desulfurase [Ochrobactrum vermis]